MSLSSALSPFRLREFNRNVQSFFLYGTSINAGLAVYTLL